MAVSEDRQLTVKFLPHMGDTTKFDILISVTIDNVPEIVANFDNDGEGFSSVAGIYGQLATWAETFFAGGGITWTLLYGSGTLNTHFESP